MVILSQKIKESIGSKRERMVKGECERGITLIALVITIIVLLILAGVTISSLGGQNGNVKLVLM